jgi:mannose-6-phosphate isomerase-like protein (cupin superfamily)
MTNRIESFAELIAPISEEQFFAEYHDKKPLHIRAQTPDKLDDVMTWDTLSEILNMTAIWTPETLKLFLDTKPIPPEQYCRQTTDRHGMPSLQPDSRKVKSWLRRGASIVANDIDTLTPGLIAAANALELRLGGKAQSNLYCSWSQHQAFPTHFDTHEVFALHVAGEKVWRIYEGRLENPIASDDFKALDDDFHAAHRGELLEEVTLQPGDILYIPRGQYHDALASSDGCIHLSFGITHIIGFDLMSLLFERAMTDPLFRRNMPLADDGAARDWINTMVARLSEIGQSDDIWAAIETFRKGFEYPRGGFNLPGDAYEEDNSARFAVTATSLKVVRHKGRAILESDKGKVPIPTDIADPVDWIVEKGQFSGDELAENFPDLTAAARSKLIQDLVGMRVLAPR